MSNLEKFLLSINFLLWSGLTVFSYSYVDLNLTLSQNPLVLNFVAFMQKFGYYARPQATLTYVVLVAAAFIAYGLNLFLFSKSKLSLKYLKLTTLTNTLILIFAYPLLSSDIFNYMFDAKIILKYHANPYTHMALDFPQDEWLRFMRWVHRYSPYGPMWLAFSIVPSILGFGKFILTLFFFKLFIGAFHLLNTILVYRILSKVSPRSTLLGSAMYALNPVFLIEGAANAHNDIILASAFLASVYFFAVNKTKFSVLSLLAGVFVKYIPILIVPWILFLSNKGQKNFKKLVILNALTLILFTIIFSTIQLKVPFVSSGATQTQFQPWYLFWSIPLLALIPSSFTIVMSLLISLGASFRYLPYLYYGDWSAPGTIFFMKAVTIAPLSFALILLIRKKINLPKFKPLFR